MSHEAPRTRLQAREILCTYCNEAHNNEMIQCDTCHIWHHLNCVGFTRKDGEELREWNCQSCLDKFHGAELTKTRNDASSQPLLSKKKSSNRELKLQLLEEEQILIRRQQEIIRQRLSLLELNDNERIGNNDNDIGVQSQRTEIQLPLNEFSNTHLSHSTPKKIVHHNPNTEAIDYLKSFEYNQARVRPNNATFIENFSSNQYAARKIMSKDLPVFTGKPEEWPIFISAYNNSTEACGFTNQENILRLQKCLKGKARELVEGRLNQPQCVPSIISSLTQLFGKPEDILLTQIEKIRRFPTVKLEKLSTLIELSVAIDNLCATIAASGVQNYDNNPTLIHEFIQKLPNQLRLDWGAYKRNMVNNSSVSAFNEWLKTTASNACEVVSVHELLNSKDKPERNTNRVNIHDEANMKSCLVCKRNCKTIDKCNKFIALSASERWTTVRNLNLCRMCLKRHNFKDKCKKPVCCDRTGCQRKHHPFMHNENLDTKQGGNDQTKNEQTHCSHVSTTKNIQFRYVPIIARHKNIRISTIAMLDEGSSGTYIEEDLAKKLQLQGPKSTLCLKWTSSTQRMELNSMCISFRVKSKIQNAKEYDIKNAQTVKNLDLPEQTLDYEALCQEYSYLKRLPVASYSNAKPAILIGLNNWKLALPLKIREGEENQPITAKCRLGWTIFANLPEKTKSLIGVCNFHTHETSNDSELHQLMKDYFATDSLGVKPPPDLTASKEDRRAKYLMHTTAKCIGNRFEIGLLWKENNMIMPNSRPTAERRLELLEKRLERYPEMKEAMIRQIHEYLQKNYIRRLTDDELKQQYERIWYLPIFPVVNPNKPNKIRMVWDAAAKTRGVSLNSFLLSGPDLLVSLFGVLNRFRQRKIGITGDIKEMFHQVRIQRSDQNAQRFLWRECNSSKEPDVYVMEVMTFGATCSPSCAQFIKNINAENFSKQYPEAVNIITKDHYVDDLLASLDTVEETIKVISQVRDIHKKGGFEIRNWKSNSKEVMKVFGSNEETLQVNMNIEHADNVEKVLGMWWSLSNDAFTYSLKFNKGNKEVLNGVRKPTKREVLRILMSIYDPLGFLTHYLTYLKILLQDIWRSKISWDEEITNEQNDKWLIWQKQLQKVEQIKIRRCYLKNFENWNETVTQLHVFVDASKDASAAVAYLRIQKNEDVEIILVGAKSRVAPLKLISIPKLELMAALIGARFAKNLQDSFSIKVSQTVFWSDSKTVLSWIQSDAKTIKGQFIAFRVAEIQDSTNITDWRYVPSRLNVADKATKWNKNSLLDSNNSWFCGPTFLVQEEKYWPQGDLNLNDSFDQTKEEPALLAVHKEFIPIIQAERFSKWVRILRTLAYIFRYINILKAKIQKIKSPNGNLRSEELLHAENILFKIAQGEMYQEEISELQKEEKNNSKVYKTVNKSSSIYNLSPYLDVKGILRVRGRIDAANCTHEDTKRPIILPRDSRITHLIVSNYHEKFLHHNHETVINEIRQRFIIPKLRQLLKNITKGCNRCKIMTAKPQSPEMAPLPAARLAAYTLPFTYTGVDYFGPMKVAVGRRIEKRWGCLFTCLTTRAIHIEIAYSLDSNSFILCFRNFTQRRGEPQEIYCDNGTNFVSAERELQEELTKLNCEDIELKLVNRNTKFKFNPPASPHMGGSWERLIKAVKKALYAIKLEKNPTDPVLRNYLMEVENIVNSRPLTYLPLDSEESEALTPNHFLRGSSGSEKPIGSFTDDAKILKNNWLLSQQYSNRFWKRWLKEYLPTLTRKTKWYTPVEPLKLGDIVIIVDEKLPRNTWLKGRVIEVRTGSNNQVRSAVIQTTAGILTRPAVKLAKLDIEEKK